MNRALKVALAIATPLIITAVLIVLLENPAWENLNVKVTSSPTPTPTSSPSSTPTPSPTSAPSITIAYYYWIGPLGYDIMMRTTVTNNGYSSFEANKTKFQVISGGKNYSCNVEWTRAYGDWSDPIVSNGETHEGDIAFNVLQPPTGNLTLVYVDASGEYNIKYITK